ncbi:MAG: 50S ribosomal protein L11 methyltransferase [Xanthobacteraceae bacterium]
MSQPPIAEHATHVMRFATEETSAKRIVEFLFAQLDPADTVVSAFEGDRTWIVEVHFHGAPAQRRLTELVREAFGGGTVPEISFDRVAAADWVATSLAGLAPVRVGRFVVHGSHDRGKFQSNAIDIEIEAALAFGTGHHGTTQGCLAAIERVARAGRSKRVLDLGTGTGVLAIAAARAFRRPAVAGEIDPGAVTAARINACANRTGAYVRVVRANGVTHAAIRAGAPYDLVLANILLKPLQGLARPVWGLLAPGATVVLSGLLPSQANSALAAWRSQGLALRRRDTIENWTTLTLARPHK